MQISKLTFANNQINNSSRPINNKKNNLLTISGYLGGGVAAAEGIFFIKDYLGEKKEYKNAQNRINELYKHEVEDSIASQLEQLKKQGKSVTQKDRESIRQFTEMSMKPIKENMLRDIKDYRNQYLIKWGLISAGIGLVVGAGAKLIVNQLSPKKSSDVKINEEKKIYNQDYYFYNQTKSRMLSFTGVLEEYADMLTENQIERWSAYTSGENPSPKELKQAEKIASYKLKDWPKGIKKYKGRESYVGDKYLPYRFISKPTSDREYQMMVLKQDFYVPPKPPKYYRLYQKIFNTDTYKAVKNDTIPYIRAGLKFERMENIVNKIRLENYQKEKTIYDMQAKKQLSLACIKSKINRDFLIDFNSEDKNANVLNSILIESKDKEERKKNIQWIVAKTNSHYVYIQDKNDSNDTRVNQIYTVLEEAVSNFKKDGKRTLLVVENFDKLLDKSSDNEEIVGDLKDLLCKLSSEYHTTLLFEADNTTNMDPIALQNHRVTKYNLDKEIPIEELKNFQNEFIRSNIRKIPDNDGFQYKYIPFKNEYIDLYLGDFGYSKDILWVNSSNSTEISAVLNNLEGIKMIPKFKDIKKVRFPKPDDMEKLEDFTLKNTMFKTLDNEYIFEYINESLH